MLGQIASRLPFSVLFLVPSVDFIALYCTSRPSVHTHTKSAVKLCAPWRRKNTLLCLGCETQLAPCSAWVMIRYITQQLEGFPITATPRSNYVAAFRGRSYLKRNIFPFVKYCQLSEPSWHTRMDQKNKK